MSYPVSVSSLVILLLLTTRPFSFGQEYRQGQYRSRTPLYDICLSTFEVERDMALIRKLADHLRIYYVDVCPDVIQTILTFAKNNDMKVIPSLYISDNRTSNAKEVAAVIPMVRNFGDVLDAVLVGQQVLFNEFIPLDELLDIIQEIKDIIKDSDYTIPVAVTDVWPTYESRQGRRLVAANDFLCLNMLPYWEGRPATCTSSACTSAADWVHEKAEALEARYKKPVWICESGWPTQGERCCTEREWAISGLRAVANNTNAETYIRELVLGGRAAQRPTYVHAFVDDDWKRIWAPCGDCDGLETQVTNPSCDTCELDYHFGLYKSDRTRKTEIEIPKSAVIRSPCDRYGLIRFDSNNCVAL